MKNRLTGKILVVTGVLVTALYSQLTIATWDNNQSDGYYKPQQYHNKSFGNFPPTDLDQTLMRDSIKTTTTEASSQTDTTETTDLQQAQPAIVPDMPPGNSRQTYQQPDYRNRSPQAYQQRLPPRYGRQPTAAGQPMNNQGFNFSSPFDNRSNNRSNNFNNNRSGFGGSWNNSGSSFNGPWNNSSGFSNPMNNNNSSFSLPWGNNGSGFSPWGNNNGWRR